MPRLVELLTCDRELLDARRSTSSRAVWRRGQPALQWLALVPGVGVPLVLLFRATGARKNLQ